jgi:hypothetical protein
VDAVQAVEAVAAEAIAEAAEAVAVVIPAVMAPLVRDLEIRGASTSRPTVMLKTTHCS